MSNYWSDSDIFAADKINNATLIKKINERASLTELTLALKEKRPKRQRPPSERTLRKNDRVNTPQGQGTISFTENAIVCVELDDDKSVLYEFDRNEIEKIKKTK